ncbi:hypothetical protein THAOC_03750, partial [Thalassiosira oceanica]
MKGDVVTHVNGEVFTGTADELNSFLVNSFEQQGGDGTVTIVVNAEVCTAEALRLRKDVVEQPSREVGNLWEKLSFGRGARGYTITIPNYRYCILMGIDDNGTLLAVPGRSSNAASLGRVLTVYLRRHIAIGPVEARLR